MFEIEQVPPIQLIEDELLKEKGITLYIKRDDLLHPEISGNKWRKLKYNFIRASELGYTRILTFGGAFSNHIAATAFAANKYGFDSIGIIRGDELNENSNHTLRQAHGYGMNLEFISRSAYRQKESENFTNEMIQKYGSAYIIPEGGSNALAVKGCSEILSDLDVEFDFLTTAVGTGGTIAGIASGLARDQKALGFCVLKGAEYLQGVIEGLLAKSQKNWYINYDHHLGGYARYNDQLIRFINEFWRNHKIPLDPIYTGKMMMGLYSEIRSGKFESGTRIIALHTGGLQGIEGFNIMHGEQLHLK